MSEPRASSTTPWKRIALIVFLSSVVVNAAIAIAAILGAGGDAEWRILGTSLLLSAASIGLIGNAAAFESRRSGPLPIAAGAAVVTAAAMGIFAIWAEPGGDGFYQWMGTFVALALAGTYSGLITLPTLATRHVWLRWSAVGVAGLLGVLAIAAIWSEDAVSDEMWGVLAVVLAALTIVIPVLSRVGAAIAGDAGAAAVRISFCPVCGAGVAATSGSDVECAGCSTSFAVTVRRVGALGTSASAWVRPEQ